MRKGRKNRLSLFLLLLFLFGASLVFAQEVEYPEIPGAETPTTKSALPDYVKYIFNLSVMIAGLVALGVLVLGGIKYLTSAGSPTAIKGAKDQIFAGILGLIILLSSYLILTTINPQLVIFHLGPLKEITVPEVPPAPPPPELATLVAAEIPLGQLIDGVGKEMPEEYPPHIYEGIVAETRLKRIRELSDEILKTSGEIVALSEQLKGLLKNCNCVPCITKCRGSCYIYERCETDEFGKEICWYVCADRCSCNCIGSKLTPGDPCPNRSAIMAIQKKLGQKAGYLQVLNSQLEKEIEDLKEVLKQLKRAEEMMKKCPTLVIKEVKLLYSMNNFWAITEVLEGGGFFKELKNGRPWLPIMGEQDPASFYCTEIPILPAEITEAEKLKVAIEETAETETTCEIEIQIGQVVEDSKNFAQKLIEKMELMSALVSSQITATNILIPLPDQCNCQGGGRHGACPCLCGCDPSCAHCEVKKECYCPEIEVGCWCIVCPCEKVEAIVKKIGCIHNEITTTHGEILKILREGERILKEMEEVRMELSECVNEDEEWMDFLLGAAILENEILSCEEAKAAKLIDSCQHQDNYFCCQTKFK